MNNTSHDLRIVPRIGLWGSWQPGQHFMEHVYNMFIGPSSTNCFLSHLGNIWPNKVSDAILWNYKKYFLWWLRFCKVNFIFIFPFPLPLLPFSSFFLFCNTALTGHCIFFPPTYFQTPKALRTQENDKQGEDGVEATPRKCYWHFFMENGVSSLSKTS